MRWTHTRAQAHSCKHPGMSRHTFTHARAHTHTCAHVYLHTHTNTHTHTHTNSHTYICAQLCLLQVMSQLIWKDCNSNSWYIQHTTVGKEIVHFRGDFQIWVISFQTKVNSLWSRKLKSLWQIYSQMAICEFWSWNLKSLWQIYSQMAISTLNGMSYSFTEPNSRQFHLLQTSGKQSDKLSRD